MVSFLNLFRFCCPRRNASRWNDAEEVVVEPFMASPPAPVAALRKPSVRIYTSRNGQSKVALTNKGTYLEIRRGDITWHKGQKATRHEWETLDEWRAWARKNL